jgi:hypothetical protein
MDAQLRQEVRARASGRCEYCRIEQVHFDSLFHFEHIIARQHGGETNSQNLAIACARCNLNKGPNIAGLDPESKKLTPLFNPRQHDWNEHFKVLANGKISGITDIGRTTVHVLAFNTAIRVQMRLSSRGPRND